MSTDSPIDLPNGLFQSLHMVLESEDARALVTLLKPLHPAETASLIQMLEGWRRIDLTKLLGSAMDGEALAMMDAAVREDLLNYLTVQNLVDIIHPLDSDDALAILQELPEDRACDVLKHLSTADRNDLKAMLIYPEDSAGRMMKREMLACPRKWTVGQALRYIVEEDQSLPDDFYDLFVLDEQRRLVGTLPLSGLLTSRRDVKLHNIMDSKVYKVPADMPQEDVALFFRTYELTSAPVVNATGRIVGMITISEAIQAMDAAAEADLLYLGGVGGSDFYTPVLETSVARMRWLMLSVINAVLGTLVIAQFEGAFCKKITLMMVMPAVVSIGGMAGMQVMTVTVRALSTKELSPQNRFRAVGKEAMVGMINGTFLAFCLGSAAHFWFADPSLGLIFGLSIFLEIVFAGLCGICVPIALDWFNLDPALSASPILTIVIDLCGYIMFFSIACWVYGI